LFFGRRKKICRTRSALFSRKNQEKLFNSVFEQFQVCNVGFYPPAYVESVVKTCLANTIDVKCDGRTNNRMEGYLKEACRKYFLPYHAYNEVYKNIYCALCDFEVSFLYIQNEIGRGHVLTNPTLIFFSALMDFKVEEKQPIAIKMKCTANQIFDEKLVCCIIFIPML
jgi:hypothetical protein